MLLQNRRTRGGGGSDMNSTAFISFVLLPSKLANTALPSLLGVTGTGEDDLLCTGVSSKGKDVHYSLRKHRAMN